MNGQYRKMLSRMKAKEEANPSQIDPWFLYILECSDGSFYTGITKDIANRFKTHSEGKGSRFTRTRLPLKLLYQESCSGRTQAMVREYAVKALSRKQKEALVGLKRLRSKRKIKRKAESLKSVLS